MKVELVGIIIKNFKGIQKFEKSFIGNTVISGRNEAGKTTISDAFFWCLFGKNSNFESVFQVKPLDSNSDEVHNLTTSVELNLSVDGNVVTLKRVLEEDWVKQRGTGEVSLKGNPQQYFINSIPVKAKEYSRRIEELANEKDFKILTSAIYFNEKINWKERREILTSLISDVRIEDIAYSKKKFKLISEEISNIGIEDAETKYKFEKKEIDKMLEELPPRIDEVNQNISNVETPEDALKSQKEIQEKITELQKEDSGQGVVQLDKINEAKKELRKAESDREDILLNRSGIEKIIAGFNLSNENDYSKIRENEEAITNSDQKKQNIQVDIDKLLEQKNSLKKDYISKSSEKFEIEEFEFKGDVICQSCGQDLPEDKKEEAYFNAKAHYDTNKEKVLKNWREGIALDLTTIQSKAENINVQIENLKRKMNTDKELLESENIKYHKEIAQRKKDIALRKLEIEKTNPQLEIKNVFIESEAKNITRMEGVEFTPQNNEEIEKLNNELRGISSQIASYEMSKTATTRLAELQKELESNNSNLLKAEQKLDLIAELKIEYINTIEGSLNNLFDRKINIKLFEKQLNGGFKETCEILYKSREGTLVPYSSVNTAGKINAGLQVINVLSEKKNIYLPIWVDNVESVEKLQKVESQTISLKMVADHGELTIR